jgi:hypothetical protein
LLPALYLVYRGLVPTCPQRALCKVNIPRVMNVELRTTLSTDLCTLYSTVLLILMSVTAYMRLALALNAKDASVWRKTPVSGEGRQYEDKVSISNAESQQLASTTQSITGLLLGEKAWTQSRFCVCTTPRYPSPKVMLTCATVTDVTCLVGWPNIGPKLIVPCDRSEETHSPCHTPDPTSSLALMIVAAVTVLSLEVISR